ncbi:autotransporter adhesin, partial [Paraburkholderia sp. GAS448]|uniref:ESPR domain-containing protein n=1 Tax=Paraburkholderia sp. GAS448 TaxID=3035136 RepID=UPI003D245D4E
MNKSYRVVWNASRRAWGVASELAKGKTKGSVACSVKVAGIIAAAGAAAFVGASSALAAVASNGSFIACGSAGQVGGYGYSTYVYGPLSSNNSCTANGSPTGVSFYLLNNADPTGSISETDSPVNASVTGAMNGSLRLRGLAGINMQGAVSMSAGLNMSGTGITGVYSGTLSSTSTDAVNGSQLFATNTNVTANATAITGLGTRVTKNESDITSINSSISGLNAGLADTVKYDSAAHDSVTLGSAGTPVQLTNVRDGALNASSVDAVNGSQLFATNTNVTNLDNRVTKNEGDITGI